MNPNGVQVTPGSPVLLLAERTPVIWQVAKNLREECHLHVEQLSGSPSAEDFEHHPHARIIIASPALLSALLPGLASSVLRWRHLFFLIECDQLLDAASYIRWADGFLFPESGRRICEVLELAAEGIAVLPPYMTAEFSLDAVRARRLDTLELTELRVLACLGSGMSNAAIGENLGRSQTNVKSVVRSLLGKLHFRNRTEAGVFARVTSDRVARATQTVGASNVEHHAVNQQKS